MAYMGKALDLKSKDCGFKSYWGCLLTSHIALIQQFSDWGLLNMLPSAAEWRSG